jgi:ankyrin repeat protein
MLEADPALADAPHGKGGALRFAAFKGDMQMARLLLEFQADPTLRNENGHSALDYAERSSNQEMVRLLSAATQPKRGE